MPFDLFEVSKEGPSVRRAPRGSVIALRVKKVRIGLTILQAL